MMLLLYHRFTNVIVIINFGVACLEFDVVRLDEFLCIIPVLL